ncbi:hypothetical protein DWW36_12380 [Erysipelotrichaceae bacterium AF15-26LB]|nr:hypothetical protein [[Clostridium] innocuum]RJV87125.1 hypothetical protein DWW36_12380 [Erysipelotrichaceae bacterium AF15-26LB]
MELILALLTGFLLPAALFLFKDRTNQKHKREELEKKLEQKHTDEIKLLTSGMCLLIRINIIDYHKRYMREGSIPLYALENVKTLYSVYSMFGENGIHDLMEELGDLPIKN